MVCTGLFSGSVDNDKRRPKLGRIRHSLDVREAPSTRGQDRDGQPVHEVLIIGKDRLDRDGLTLRLDDLEVLHDRLVLLVDVHELQVLLCVTFTRFLETKLHCLRLRRRRRQQRQRQKRPRLDGIQIGTRPGHDEGLIQRVERHVARARRQEGQLGCDFPLEGAVPALLLPFLAQDGRDAAG